MPRVTPKKPSGSGEPGKSRGASHRSVQRVLDFEAPQRSVNRLSADEVYALASEEILANLKEGSCVERKPPGMHARALADYISMWANTAPEGGLIVVGQADDGTFPGTQDTSIDKINELEKCGTVYVPDARYHVKKVAIGSDKSCLLFRVEYHASRVVETVSGDAFVRRGDSKFRLSDEEKQQLALDKGQKSVEQEPCGLTYPDDFEMAEIQRFAAAVIARKGLRTDNSVTKVLCSRMLGSMNRDGDFVPNIACALLFAKEPLRVIPGSSIRFQRYEGTRRLTGERRNVVKDIRIEGRITDIITETDTVIQSQIRDYSRLGPRGKFFTAPEYPRPAWYEAVVNACVHRSYHLKNTNVFIRMFDDRMEIESPGGFPPFITPENIYQMHQRRNFFLMDALYFLDFVKGENEGTNRMRDEMQAMELPDPEFSGKNTEVGHALVRVTLRNNHERRKLWIDKSAADVVGELVFSQLDEREKRCINFAAEHGRITVAEAARLHAVDWKTGKKILERLVTLKLLEWVSRYPKDSSAHYRLPARKKS